MTLTTVVQVKPMCIIQNSVKLPKYHMYCFARSMDQCQLSHYSGNSHFRKAKKWLPQTHIFANGQQFKLLTSVLHTTGSVRSYLGTHHYVNMLMLFIYLLLYYQPVSMLTFIDFTSTHHKVQLMGMSLLLLLFVLKTQDDGIVKSQGISRVITIHHFTMMS